VEVIAALQHLDKDLIWPCLGVEQAESYFFKYRRDYYKTDMLNMLKVVAMTSANLSHISGTLEGCDLQPAIWAITAIYDWFGIPY